MVLTGLLAWPLAGFGGTTAIVAIPFSLTCVALALYTRPRVTRDDRSLFAAIAVVALQLTPLPAAVVSFVSPRAAGVRDAMSLAPSSSPFVPLTIDTAATAWALAVFAAGVAVFLMARARFADGGIRRTVRLIAAAGFVVSLLAIAQAATAGRRIYWAFPTEFEGPLPFGPFVNRNHFATWAIMAIPVCFGYFAARSGQRDAAPGHVAWRRRVAAAIDPRSAWLAASVVVMVVALLSSTSRSGVVALGLSAAIIGLGIGARMAAGARRIVAASIVSVVLLGALWADIPGLRARFAGTGSGVANRTTIWRATVPVIEDFPVAGTGAGTYARAMLIYQRENRGLMFNQAHNHYLQAAAEGGLLLVAALAAVLIWLLRAARRRLREETSALLWIRAGAACGLVAVALQSMWETGLVMPANAALAAVLAAIVTVEKSS